MPVRLAIRATRYPESSPINMGTSLKNPLANTDIPITTAKTKIAMGQLVEASLIPLGERETPITTITGPVTTGGKNCRTFSLPTAATSKDRAT